MTVTNTPEAGGSGAFRKHHIIDLADVTSRTSDMPGEVPLVLVMAAHGQATNSGFIVYGGLLIDEQHVDGLAHAAAGKPAREANREISRVVGREPDLQANFGL